MKRFVDLSIGQRLTIGFGGVLLVLGAFVAAVAYWNAGSARTQQRYADQIVPVREQAEALERSVLYVGIAMRSFLLQPDSDRLARYRAATERVLTVNDAFRRMPMDGTAATMYSELAPVLQAYLREVDAVVERRSNGPGALDETAVAASRERAIDALRSFVHLQEANAQAALADIAVDRRRVNYGLATASALLTLSFLVLALATTNAIRRPVRSLLALATALEKGDWRPALAMAGRAGGAARAREPRDEMLRLGRAFAAAGAALQNRELRLRAEGDVASAAGSSLDEETVAGRVLAATIAYMRAEVGIVYAIGDDDVMHVIASYGAGSPAPLRIGEGVPGQAARARGPVIVADIPPDSGFEVKLGYDAAPPRTVAAVPLVFQDRVLGVLAVASLREFDEDARVFLNRTAVQLAISLANVRSHERIQLLVSDLAEKNDAIQAQNSELQAQNEEIHAQADQLRLQTEEIQAQHEEIQAQNDDLRSQADDLRRHTTLLAEADARKDDFLGVLAHELRNPLAALANSAWTLRGSDPASDRAKRAQAVIERQTQQLARLVDDLLDVTRISHGKVRLEPCTLDFTALVRAVADDHREMLAASGLHFELVVPDESVWLHGDRTRLAQVIGNLLSNAAKFTGPGGRVTLALTTLNSLVELRVADTGMGIGPALISRLFQPFTQAADGASRSRGGLGLGLALAKTLVELHHGAIEAHSDGPGHGAEFVVRLPLLAAPLDSPEAPRLDREPVRRRVLVIDDDSDARQSLRDVLECEGQDVQVAGSGQQGLECARTFHPEVVLCDIGMPGVDGYETARRFRADAQLSSVLLVALTGYAMDADKRRAFDSGFDLYLTKPPDVTELIDLVASLEGRQVHGRGAGASSAML
jgi:signal transduction histidine kinase/CheY-like chemotaxis protein/CHASE3 domain sensor protein